MVLVNTKKPYSLSFSTLLFIIGSTISQCVAIAAEWNPPFKFKNDDIRIGVNPRTPSQMAAFYEGRGFPKNAIEATTQYCFITIGIRNTGKQKIWLDLSQWRFYDKNGVIVRKDKTQWKATWKALNVPLSSQATFNWTTLPEVRDLHRDEPVGGNITLTPTYTPFTIEARFPTGENKKGALLIHKIENIRCLKNGEEVKR